MDRRLRLRWSMAAAGVGLKDLCADAVPGRSGLEGSSGIITGTKYQALEVDTGPTS